jgi:predicted nuclease with TOPRIM domain
MNKSDQEILEEIGEIIKEYAELEAEVDTLNDTIRTLKIKKKKLIRQLSKEAQEANTFMD